MKSQTSRIANIALLMMLLFLLPSILTAQTVRHEYHLAFGDNPEILQKGLQEAADRGYRLLPGQGHWYIVVLEKPGGDVEPLDYLLLTGRAAKMQKEMDEASAQGYRLATVLGCGFKPGGWRGVKEAWSAGDLVLVMQREKGKTTSTQEYKVLGTRRPKTMQEELNAEGQKGFLLVGVDETLQELRAVMERPLQSTPVAHEYLVPYSSWVGFDPAKLPEILDRGFRLLPELVGWSMAPVFEKSASDGRLTDYLQFGVDTKQERFQKALDEASAKGYRFLGFAPGGLVMQREKGKATRTHELKIIRARKVQEMEKDLLAEGQAGFRIACVTGFWIYLERPD